MDLEGLISQMFEFLLTVAGSRRMAHALERMTPELMRLSLGARLPLSQPLLIQHLHLRCIPRCSQKALCCRAFFRSVPACRGVLRRAWQTLSASKRMEGRVEVGVITVMDGSCAVPGAASKESSLDFPTGRRVLRGFSTPVRRSQQRVHIMLSSPASACEPRKRCRVYGDDRGEDGGVGGQR